MDVKAKIEELRKELHQHNHNYYVLNNPTLTDKEFDDLLRHLQELELAHPEYNDSNSPTQRVGSDIDKRFTQKEHKYPMLSLANTYSEEEVSEFYDRVTKGLGGAPFELCCELKFDGSSISLTYENGQFVDAVTRGDGTRGDVVTDNVKTIRTVPLVLSGDTYPALFEIRGEILLPWKSFDALNEERERNEEPLLANPRNAASGTLKQQNSSVVAKRKLDAYLYYMIGENLPHDGHYENLQEAAKWGFKVSEDARKCKTLQEVFDFIHHWDVARKDLPVATDGIVLKVNSIRQQEELGYTAKSPRWAIAYKFQAEKQCTKLEEVTYQVGRTGAITPVANLEAVHLSGTVVKRASLHNEDIINSLDLHIGDLVYVEKGGEIIPKITDVNLEARKNNPALGPKVEFIKTCPECGTELIRYEGEAAHYCPNVTGCPTQIKGRIVHFIGRRAMNIDGLGPETIDLFYKEGLLHNVADLYKLSKENLQGLDRIGDKTVNKILTELEESKKVPFARALFALGIRFVGETVAKKLAKAFTSVEELANANLEQLVAVDEIGEKIAASILEYFGKEENREMVKELVAFGLQLQQDEEETANQTNKLDGAAIVVSGVFSKHSRDEYKALIEQNGGRNAGSISGKTTYVLAGENMGPAKLEKAEKLGVKILNEDEFLALIDEE